MIFKKMIGEKVILTPLDGREAERVTEWLNDPEVTLGTTLAEQSLSLNRETELLRQMEQEGSDFYIIARDSGQAIGTIGVTRWNHVNQWANVGIMIGDKNYWKRGYGTEAMALLCDYCLNILNCHSVRLEVYSFNLPAIACYEKVGFRECGRFHEAKKIGGKWYDCIQMELLEDQFSSLLIKRLVEERMQVKA